MAIVIKKIEKRY